MDRVKQIKWSDSARQIHASKESWREFIDALYEANPGVLPPKEYVVEVGMDVFPGEPPRFTFTLIGLKLPTTNHTLTAQPVIGENGVPD